MGNSPRAIVRGLIRGGRAVTAQWNRWGLMITLTSVLAVAGSIALYFFRNLHGTPLSNGIRNIAAVAEQVFSAGMASTVTTMLWSAAMTIWLLGAFLARGRTSSPQAPQFFLTTALLSFLLMMEDAVVIPYLIPQAQSGLSLDVLMGANGLFLLVYIRAFARQILESEYLFLVAALASFGTSMGINALVPTSHDAALFSGCFMLVGITFWVLYPATTIPFFLQRMQVLEWSRETLQMMMGTSRHSAK